MRTPLAATLLLAAATTLAQPPKRPMTFADLQAMKRVSDPQISPSGHWVLFSVTEVSLDQNTKANHLWIVPLDGKSPERQLTQASGESEGRFSPNGKSVLFAHKGQLWVAPFDDATGTLGDDHVITTLETGADGGLWAPDSQHILFTSTVYPDCESKAPLGPQRNAEEAACNAQKDAAADKDPVKALIFTDLLYRHWDHYVGPKHSHIFYADTTAPTQSPTDLTPASVIGDHEAPTFSLGGPLGYAISPDGKEIAYETNLDPVPAESTNNDIFTLQLGAEPSTAKKVSTSPGSDDGPQYSPDGKWLAWRSQARKGYESDKFDLVVMDRAARVIHNLSARFDSWVDEFSWAPDSNSVFVATPARGEELIYRLTVQGDQVSELTYTCIAMNVPCIHAELGSIQPFPSGKALVLTRMSVDAPTEIVAAKFVQEDPNKPWYQNPCRGCWGEIFERDDSQKQWDIYKDTNPLLAVLEPLTHMNDEQLSALNLPPQESFWFPGANNTKVQGFLIRPPNFDPSKKYPVKFLIHGGPQGAWGDAWSYRWNPELFAADGYVVIMVNPRGSVGYGQKFLEQVSGDWGGRPYTDLMKGLDYAEAHYPFIDKSKECALGASYGGFMADWILTQTNRFKCIVTHDGMSDPAAAFGDTEELWFNEWEFRPLASASPEAVVEQTKPSHPWDFDNKPDAENPYIKFSPMRFIKNAHTPTLIVHGQRDYRLDVSQGLELFTALQLLHVPSKMLYFEDEGHWVLKPRDSELWYQTVNDWCDRWTGMGKYASAGPEKNPAAAHEK